MSRQPKPTPYGSNDADGAEAPHDLRVLVVTSGWPSPDHPSESVFVKDEVDRIRERGVKIDVVHYKGSANPLNYLRARREVRRRLRTGGYDLVHAHFGQTLVVVRGVRVPAVVSFHGSDLIGVVTPSGRYGLKGRLLQAISRRLVRDVEAVIVPSRALRERLPAGVRSSVVPGSVDTNIFRPAPKEEARKALGLPLERKLVLFGGSRKVPVKRYALARAAVDQLPHPGADLIDVHDVTRRVMATYMAAADVLLVTSRHESGPLVVKEALSCNLPVVSVDVGDVRETIGTVSGCAVCADDRPETIATALESVLGSVDVFDPPIGSESFDPSELTERVIGVYRSALCERGAKT